MTDGRPADGHPARLGRRAFLGSAALAPPPWPRPAAPPTPGRPDRGAGCLSSAAISRASTPRRPLRAGRPPAQGQPGPALDAGRLQPPRRQVGAGVDRQPQPARLQGRHGQPRRHRQGADGRAGLGRGRRGRARPGGGRQLPGRPHHPHATRPAGPRSAGTARTTTPATATTRPATGGFNFSRGFDAAGRLDQGLAFVSYQKSLVSGFLAVQARLKGEPLEEYILPVGGGFFFVLPGVASDDAGLGQQLLA
jgi:hypothetical protein